MKKKYNILGTLTQSANLILRILIVVMVVALLMTIKGVAAFVGSEMVPLVTGGQKATIQQVQSVAIDILLVATGIFLTIIAAKVIVPVLAISLAVVGVGLIFYYGKNLFDGFKKKSSSNDLSRTI